jgi:hypothetical protein
MGTMNRFLTVISLLLGFAYFAATQVHGPPDGPPRPAAPAAPKKTPEDEEARKRPWRPFRPHGDAEGRQPVESGFTSPDGKEDMACQLPESEKKHNVGGRDGSGLCVFTSIEYVGRYVNEPELWDFQQNMRKELGGGYPEKVDVMVKKYAPHFKYLQHTAGDPAVLKAALKSGRMCGVTYNGHDCHYGNHSIAHMVSLTHYSDDWAAVSDNNFPKDAQHVWMSPDEFNRRWKGMGGGWAVIPLKFGPPPPPRR